MSGRAEVCTLRGVGKTFPGARGLVTVLRDIDAAIYAGDRLVITGPSGSGKTTLLHLLGLLDLPTTGQLLLEGRDPALLDDLARSRLRRDRVGMIFQRFFLLPHRSALENVAFRFRYSATPREEQRARARQALAEVGLAQVSDTPARVLSGGEMQRVAIARAMVMPPALLLADEPTGNLDHESAEHVMQALMALAKQGVTLVMATHNPEWIKLANRHWICRDGMIREASS